MLLIRNPSNLTDGVNGTSEEISINDLLLKSNSELGFILNKSKNLFDKNATALNYFVNWVSGDLQYNDGLNCAASDFIPITPGESYNLTAGTFFGYTAFYDVNRNFLSGNANQAFPLIASVNSAYIRITVRIANLTSAQFELGTISTNYIPFSGFLSQLKTLLPPSTARKLTTIGDSITAGNSWQPGIINRFNVTHTNCGISGTALAGGIDGDGTDGYWTTQRINMIPVDTDILIVLGGANDYARSYPIGLISSTDTNSFYGALHKFIERAQTRAPNAKIFLATTTYGEYPPFSGNVDYANTIGLTTRDYADAIRTVARYHGLPCIDFNANGLVNKFNRAMLIPDGLHPETYASQIMANIACNTILNVEPLTPV